MAWFAGRLFVGGGRGPLEGGGGAAQDRGHGAEIAAFDPGSGGWEMAFRSPLDAEGVARDRSVRAFAVHRGALWAAMGSLRGQVVLLRSEDGRRFAEAGPPGLDQGDADIAAVRCLLSLEDSLVTSPVGLNRGRGWADDNVAAVPAVMASDDPARGRWQVVSEPRFGDEGNESVNEVALFAGAVWAATLNRRAGFQLWRGEPRTGGPWDWERVLDRGAFRGVASPVPAAMAAFGDALYVGTGVQRQPGEGLDRFGPVAPELVRVRADGSWDLVAGEARITPQGLKLPLSGRGPGFGDPFVQAFWRMAVHDGHLYVGGSDWRAWPSYLRRGRPDLSPVALEWLQGETRAWAGDYGLWRSADGASWEAVTQEGLGRPEEREPQAYGLRELLSTPLGLVAVPASRAGAGGGGGLDVWLARRRGTAA